jgi:hypothetical protein
VPDTLLVQSNSEPPAVKRDRGRAQIPRPKRRSAIHTIIFFIYEFSEEMKITCLEVGQENMRIRAGEQHKCQKSAEAPAENSRTNLLEAALRSSRPRLSGTAHERVSDVRCVVDTQADSQHEINTGHDIYCQAPPVHESSHIHLKI